CHVAGKRQIHSYPGAHSRWDQHADSITFHRDIEIHRRSIDDSTACAHLPPTDHSIETRDVDAIGGQGQQTVSVLQAHWRAAGGDVRIHDFDCSLDIRVLSLPIRIHVETHRSGARDLRIKE